MAYDSNNMHDCASIYIGSKLHCGPSDNDPTALSVYVSLKEKPQKFNELDFKQWQQNMLFYLTTLNLARFLSKDVSKLKEDDFESCKILV